MKRIITIVTVLVMIAFTLDHYIVDAILVGFNNDEVLYEDTRGHIWAIERDKDATYRLDQNVSLFMRRNFNLTLEDDEIVNIFVN